MIIPSNDDAIRAVKLLTGKIADAIMEGRQGESMDGEEQTELGDYNNDAQVGKDAKEHFESWQEDARQAVKDGYSG